MYNERRFLGLKIVIFLALINSVITVGHFILLDWGILEPTSFNGDILEYALPITLSGILPLLAGAFGMYKKRMWGLGFFTLGNGAYLFASVSLIKLTFDFSQPSVMFWAAVYLLIYSILAHFYSWNIRYSLRDF